MIRKYDSQGEVVYLILREPTTKYICSSMKSLKFCSSKTSESNNAKSCILIESNLVVFFFAIVQSNVSDLLKDSNPMGLE